MISIGAQRQVELLEGVFEARWYVMKPVAGLLSTNMPVDKFKMQCVWGHAAHAYNQQVSAAWQRTIDDTFASLHSRVGIHVGHHTTMPSDHQQKQQHESERLTVRGPCCAAAARAPPAPAVAGRSWLGPPQRPPPAHRPHPQSHPAALPARARCCSTGKGGCANKLFRKTVLLAKTESSEWLQ